MTVKEREKEATIMCEQFSIAVVKEPCYILLVTALDGVIYENSNTVR